MTSRSSCSPLPPQNISPPTPRFSSTRRTSAAFGQSLIDAISEKLKAQNKPYAVSLSQKPASIQGGMILAEGNIETNLSYEILIKNMRDELEAEVAKVLTE